MLIAALQIDDHLHLLLGMSGRIELLDASLEEIGIAEIEELGKQLILAARHVAQQEITEADGYGVRIELVLIFADEAQRGADVQMWKNGAAVVIREAGYIAMHEMLFSRLNFHDGSFFNIKHKLKQSGRIRRRQSDPADGGTDRKKRKPRILQMKT